MSKKPVGQAYNKAQTHIYTWYSDGSVDRVRITRSSNGMTLFGNIEEMARGITHSDREFWSFVKSGD